MQVHIGDVTYVCEVIPGFEHYAATSNGLIITLRYKGHANVVRVMRPAKTDKGYLVVNLREGGKLFRRRVHRLVWEAYNGCIPAGMEINHKDENKENNCLTNLELTTHVDNLNYGTHNARAALTKRRTARRRGDSHNAVSVVLNIGGTVITYKSVMDAIDALGISKRHFYNCLNKGVIAKRGKVLATVVR